MSLTMILGVLDPGSVYRARKWVTIHGKTQRDWS